MYFLPDVNKDRIKVRDEIAEILQSEEAEKFDQETKDMLNWALEDLTTGRLGDYLKGKAYYNYYKEELKVPKELKEPNQPKLEEVDKKIRTEVDNNLKDIRNGEWKSGN